MDYGNFKPKLYCSLNIGDEGVVATRNGEEFSLESLPFQQNVALEILHKFDGSHTFNDILSEMKSYEVNLEQLVELVDCLSEYGLVLKNQQCDFVSGTECLLEVEDLQNKLLYEVLYKNIFWEKCQTPKDVPLNVFIGMGIENYHFLYRESWFDAPILSWQGSKSARVLMNEFFCEEYGHDELILKSLNAVGITREDIFKTVPLPETLALCNALAYWAANDPLFFYTTLGVLEGKDLKLDSYVSAMENSDNVPLDFIQYIKDHSMINLNEEHGNLGRELFKKIPVISRTDADRLKSNTYLFIDIYNKFYSAIWQHYSASEQLLRLVK
ncbi:iron-containing redox enzyme family protein [Dickeya chrysanthemi]|uniref:iron-containing redox enzyme family protein n=1 Tax=Dickeya chrysanthemi TaxID=556 RepID=UPI0003A7D696|nr:iron-containing redox enzyme family protein [Dickeya chrysanthemi]